MNPRVAASLADSSNQLTDLISRLPEDQASVQVMRSLIVAENIGFERGRAAAARAIRYAWLGVALATVLAVVSVVMGPPRLHPDPYPPRTLVLR